MSGKFAKDRQAGRADASSGRYKPPSSNIFNSPKTAQERAVRAEHYKEGYRDKRREMGK